MGSGSWTQTLTLAGQELSDWAVSSHAVSFSCRKQKQNPKCDFPFFIKEWPSGFSTFRLRTTYEPRASLWLRSRSLACNVRHWTWNSTPPRMFFLNAILTITNVHSESFCCCWVMEANRNLVWSEPMAIGQHTHWEGAQPYQWRHLLWACSSAPGTWHHRLQIP